MMTIVVRRKVPARRLFERKMGLYFTPEGDSDCTTRCPITRSPGIAAGHYAFSFP